MSPSRRPGECSLTRRAAMAPSPAAGATIAGAAGLDEEGGAIERPPRFALRMPLQSPGPRRARSSAGCGAARSGRGQRAAQPRHRRRPRVRPCRRARRPPRPAAAASCRTRRRAGSGARPLCRSISTASRTHRNATHSTSKRPPALVVAQPNSLSTLPRQVRGTPAAFFGARALIADARRSRRPLRSATGRVLPILNTLTPADRSLSARNRRPPSAPRGRAPRRRP
jgi:hypothetical protein